MFQPSLMSPMSSAEGFFISHPRQMSASSSLAPARAPRHFFAPDELEATAVDEWKPTPFSHER